MTNAEKNIRTFLAIEPPEDILQAMSSLQEKLKREVNGKITWTRPEGRHLTLKFFGDVSMEDVDKISGAVLNRVASGLSLNLKVEKPGVFPDARKPRVLWCGMAGDVSQLSILQKQLDTDFEALGFPKEDRPFRAHITLARMKDPRGMTGLGEAMAKHGAFAAGEFICRELILFQSQLTPRGAIYTRLAVFPLNG